MSSPATPATGTKPTLHTGDRMSPAEFDRIYADLHDVRAELIDGVVYVASPVRIDFHGRAHTHLVGVIATYLAGTDQVDGFNDGTILLPGGGRVQPDVCLYALSGPARVNTDGYLEGVPEFVAEISYASSGYDLREKYELYEHLGIREYLVWRPADLRIDFFRNTSGSYARIAPGPDGIIESVTFPGLRFHITALLSGDLKSALAAVGNS